MSAPAVFALQPPIIESVHVAALVKPFVPVLLMPANPKRVFYCLNNDQVNVTIVAGNLNYILWDPLFFSFGAPQTSGPGGTAGQGCILQPGGYEPSIWGQVSKRDIWVWSPLTLGPRAIIGYDGIPDPNPDAYWKNRGTL